MLKKKNLSQQDSFYVIELAKFFRVENIIAWRELLRTVLLKKLSDFMDIWTDIERAISFEFLNAF